MGGINVRIGYRMESYGINLIIDIRDTGIGMTDSQMLKMYDDFYQALMEFSTRILSTWEIFSASPTRTAGTFGSMSKTIAQDV